MNIQTTKKRNWRIQKKRVFKFVPLVFFCCYPALAAVSLQAPNGTLGHNLEAFTTVNLSEPAPVDGLQITVSADGDQQLLFSTGADVRGSKTLVLKLRPHQSQTPDFYIQAIGAPGVATYTVSAPGSAPSKGSIKIVPSAIVIGGPSDSSYFKTTSGTPRKIRARTAFLDERGAVAGSQPVAGGLSIKLDIASSDPKVGVASPSSVQLTGGESDKAVLFQPSAPGNTTLTASASEGFTAPSKIAIDVELPGIAVLTDLHLGKDLQIMGYVLLGEDAPKGGLDVTLTSEDPKRLVVSKKADSLGSESITLHIPDGEGKAPYFLQGLADSEIVHYTATAPGYRTRDGIVGLNPSGVMVVFTPFGPPDEDEVLHPMPNPNPRPFSASLADKKPLWLSVWPVYLDPVNHRGADITAQRLRPGITVAVELKNSNPSVASVAPSLTLSENTFEAVTQFHPLSAGETTISINTPNGFTTPSNATSVKAVIRP